MTELPPLPNLLYLLNEDREVIPCPEGFNWGEWIEKTVGFRSVGSKTFTSGDTGIDIWVATTFTGTNSSIFGGPPLVFETMVFRNGHASESRKASSWQEAEQNHQIFCEKVKKEIERG